MNKVMRYPIVQAVGFGISTALAVETERMPLFAVGRPGGVKSSGSRRYPHDTKKLPDSVGSGSFLQLLPG